MQNTAGRKPNVENNKNEPQSATFANRTRYERIIPPAAKQKTLFKKTLKCLYGNYKNSLPSKNRVQKVRQPILNSHLPLDFYRGRRNEWNSPPLAGGVGGTIASFSRSPWE
jgi:hypothetical protein